MSEVTDDLVLCGQGGISELSSKQVFQISRSGETYKSQTCSSQTASLRPFLPAALPRGLRMIGVVVVLVLVVLVLVLVTGGKQSQLLVPRLKSGLWT